ncbi:MAG: hypothetical protein EOO20_15930 [Chryseobacterium sp.]|nr:MAG: hypothetical protein EOO20_15930 [Chryseobacterium sp.]
MKRVKSLVFNTFNLDDQKEVVNIDLTALLAAERYEEEKGVGFTKIQGDRTQAEAVLMKRNLTYIQEFDSLSQELIRKQIAVYTSVKFAIDLSLGLLTVFGNQTQLNSVRTMLRNVAGLSYSSEPISLNAAGFNKILMDKGINSRIHQITIRQFNYDNGMVGRFGGDITKQSTAAELLEQYGTGIVKIAFILSVEEQELLVQILSNGNIKFLCEEEDFDYYLDYLKQIIFS